MFYHSCSGLNLSIMKVLINNAGITSFEDSKFTLLYSSSKEYGLPTVKHSKLTLLPPLNRLTLGMYICIISKSLTIMNLSVLPAG